VVIPKSLSWAESYGQKQEGLESSKMDSGLESFLTTTNDWYDEPLDGWELDKNISGNSLGWNYIRSIPKKDILRLAALEIPRGPRAKGVRLTNFSDGMNNRTAIVEFDSGMKYCIRIPTCGSTEV
jgi:hypothetical protein